MHSFLPIILIGIPCLLIVLLIEHWCRPARCEHKVYDPVRNCCAVCGNEKRNILRDQVEWKTDAIGELPIRFRNCFVWKMYKVIWVSSMESVEWEYIDPIAPPEIHRAWDEMMIIRYGRLPKEPLPYDY